MPPVAVCRVQCLTQLCLSAVCGPDTNPRFSEGCGQVWRVEGGPAANDAALCCTPVPQLA